MENELFASLGALLPVELPVRRARVLTPAGREALREATLRNRPWEHCTGPRTAAGKAKSSRNAVKTGMARELMLIEQEIKAIGGLLRGWGKMSNGLKSNLIRRGLV